MQEEKNTLKPKSNCPYCHGGGFQMVFRGGVKANKEACHCLSDGQPKPNKPGFFERMVLAAKSFIIQTMRTPNTGCPNCRWTGKMGSIACWCVTRKAGPKLYKFPAV